MNRPCTRLAAALAALVLLAAPARGAFTLIDFDNTPSRATAGNTFTTAAQAITVPGVATVTGGTLVGNPLDLASFGPGGGLKNAYGTVSSTNLGYAQNLTVTFDPSILVTNVTGTLFNGYADLVSYRVDAFNGASNVGTANFTDVEESTSTAGFRSFNLGNVGGITSLVITPDTTFTSGGWDYFVDNIGVTYTIVVPEPSAAVLLGLGLLTAGAGRRRLARRAA